MSHNQVFKMLLPCHASFLAREHGDTFSIFIFAVSKEAAVSSRQLERAPLSRSISDTEARAPHFSPPSDPLNVSAIPMRGHHDSLFIYFKMRSHGICQRCSGACDAVTIPGCPAQCKPDFSSAHSGPSQDTSLRNHSSALSN